jgi:uncharacterized protein
MQNIIQYKSFADFAVKDVDTSGRTLVQAFTRYHVKDSDEDIGRPGMFTKTWSENFQRIKHILNHDITKPVGRPEKLWEDNEYAYMKSKIGTHILGDDFIKMADSGLITEASYGYNVIRENKTNEGNELLEVKLWEISSLTGWGANQYTPIISLQKGVQKADALSKMVERMKALEKFCKDSDATDETIQLLLIETKQLQQHIIDISTSSTPAAEQAPEPQTGIKSEDYLLLSTSLENQLLKLKSY